MTSFFRLSLYSLIIAAVCACGQKGPLTLPVLPGPQMTPIPAKASTPTNPAAAVLPEPAATTPAASATPASK